MKYFLISDVVSNHAPYPIYGSAGTEVTILHDHLNMMIVQDNDGKIFHSRTDNLTSNESEVKYGQVLGIH